MIPRYKIAALISIVTLTLAGCAESARENATGKAVIRAVNAIVDAPAVVFKIEERSLGSLEFGDVTPIQNYDDLAYNFNYDITDIGATSSRRLASQFLDVVADTNYLFVLSGSISNPQITLWTDDERQWEGTETVFEMGFMHLASNLGALDVYFAAPGTAPTAGAAVGTLVNGERLDPAEYAAGNYVVTLTEANDPQAIVYQSPSRTLAGASTDSILIFDHNPTRNSDVHVRHLTQAGTAADLVDARVSPTGQFLHAAPAIGNVDIAENDDFASLLLADQPFGNLSGEITLSAGTNDYTWTDAGNMGAILVESEEVIAADYKRTLVLAGPAADHTILNVQSIRRPFSTSARLNIINAADNAETVDIYFLPDGDSIADFTPISSGIPFTFSTGMTPVIAGDYEITITVAGSQTVLAGPLDISLANRDVVEVYVMDTADPNAMSLMVNRVNP
ncbi:DUF4397 domain-containing protein [Woeseia oceani]|uniref:DUF4397 domain-containing protein n=1 Tax=Woeseia oceani TaxID=1548547 RepID=A0A193LER7_9GAMM|nr:DUF4397 domain-containing protein [Woeseia oceani]ANO51002.1 hypothetical protein BA177_07065 [Woeseia oceani]